MMRQKKRNCKRSGWLRASAMLLAIVIMLQTVSALSMPVYAGDGTTVIIIGGTSNVRSGAGTNNSIISTAGAGREFEYLSESTDSSGTKWYKIQFSSSKTGWVSSSVSCKLTAETKADPQAFISAIGAKYGAVGIQVAAVRSGELYETYSSGWAIKNNKAMTDDANIRVASLSKVIIAMTAMKMQEEGLVDLDTAIAGYWDVTMPKKVSLRNLLTHSSTLSDLTPGKTPTEIRNQITKSASFYTNASPGSSSVWHYNNYGAALAGSTLEMAYGTIIDSYAESRFFAGLGIDAAWMSGRVDTTKLVNTYYSDGTIGRAASVSASLTGSDSPGYNTSYYAGGFTTCAAHYAKLIAVLANDGTYGKTRYLTAESVAEIEKQHFTASENGGSFSQCLALRYKSGLYGRSGIYYHTGNAYGVVSQASYDPDTRDAVVVVTTGCTQGRDPQGIYSVCSIISKYFYDRMNAVPRVPAEAIDIDHDTVELERGVSCQLTAVLAPADSDSAVVWSSSDSGVASVSADGTVTATGIGTAVITASAEGLSDCCTVTVVNPAQSITLDQSELILKTGENGVLTASVDPSDSTDSVIWSSTDSTVVTVDETGRITAAGPGTATITATAGNVSASCTVTVKELFKFKSYRIILGNSLNLEFFFPKNAVEDWTGHYVYMDRAYADGRPHDIRIIPVEEWGTYQTDYYKVVYDKIAAKEMCDEITLMVCNAEGEPVSKTYTLSVRGYAMSVIKNATLDLERTAFVDMLNYGAEMQKYKGYNTDDLANSLLTEEQKAYATPGTVPVESTLTPGPNCKSIVLVNESNIRLRLTYQNITPDMYVVVDFINHYKQPVTARIEGSEFEPSGDRYFFYVEEMVVADARIPINVTVYNADGTVFSQGQVSVEDYYARAGANNAADIPLQQATIKFCDAAYAYLHRNDQ